MDSKTVTIIAALIIAGFMIGRFSAPEKIKIETKTITVEVEKIAEAKSVDTSVITTSIQRPDGTKIARQRNVNKKEVRVEHEATNSGMVSITKEVTNRRGVVVSIIGGIDLLALPKISYGASVAKPVLGPLNLGVWYLTNSTFGVSIGVEL